MAGLARGLWRGRGGARRKRVQRGYASDYAYRRPRRLRRLLATALLSAGAAVVGAVGASLPWSDDTGVSLRETPPPAVVDVQTSAEPAEMCGPGEPLVGTSIEVARSGLDTASSLAKSVQAGLLTPIYPAHSETSARVLLESALERLPASRSQFGRLHDGADGMLVEQLTAKAAGGDLPLEIEYSFDRELSERVFELLGRYRVDLGHVIVADARSGRLLVYASSDTERFPPTRAYPAASLIKVVTTAATLRHAPGFMDRDCHFRGNPYRLSRASLTPAGRGGRTATFRRALATSNNQCFAQLAVHALGARPLFEQLAAFGWLSRPAPGFEAGRVTTASNDYDLGLLGCGLAGTQITPLHAAQLALMIASGKMQQPYWIERVTAGEREIPVPERAEPRVVLRPGEVKELRELLTETTRSGTAHKAFRHRGRPLLQPVDVAGKTGSLNGHNPDGRYEWFVGVAPAQDPDVAIAVLTVHRQNWMRSASQLAAEVLQKVFCPKGVCSAAAAQRYLSSDREAPRPSTAPATTARRSR